MSTEIRALRDTELQAHSELVHASYYEYVASGERTFLADPEWWLKGVQADPYYRPEQTRVMLVDGKMVSSVTAYTRDTYVDGRIAKAGCIGSVCTHPDYRRQGLVRQVLAETVEWMEQSGYHWSLLFGKEEVYGGSGFLALTSFELVADLRLRDDAPAPQVRPVEPERDVAALVEIYATFNRTLTGPVLRNEAYWRQRVLNGRFGKTPSYFMVETDGRPIGYFSGEDAHVRELGWIQQPSLIFSAILRQWPETPVRFGCFTGDMVRYLRGISQVPSAAALWQHAGGLTVPEVYKGLWRYIGDNCRCFPEVKDTAGLLRFLRQHEYNFWPADGF